MTYAEDEVDSSAHKLRRLSGNLSNGSFGANDLVTSNGNQ